MELLDRYLQAIKWWLPGSQKEDIIRELRDDLRSQLDDRREELGRDLSEAEIAEIVKRCGRPIVVAGRYLPQQHLIGPAVYPMYRAVLKAVAFFYLVPWVLVWLGLVVFFPGYRNAHPGEALLKTWATFWQFALVAFGAVTAVFAAIDRAKDRPRLLDSWNPSDLPRLRDAKRIPRAGSAIEMALSFLFTAWWVDLPRGFPVEWSFARAGLRWSPGAVWQDFHERLFWPVLVLAVSSIVLSAVNFLRPYRTRLRLTIRAAGDVATAILVAIVLAPHWPAVRAEIVSVKAHRAGANDLLFATSVTDVSIFLALAVTVLVCLCQAIYDAYRISELSKMETG